MKHTKEPWIGPEEDRFGSGDYPANGLSVRHHNTRGPLVIAFFWTDGDIKEEQRANAERAILCVNTLAGVKNPAETMQKVKRSLATISEWEYRSDRRKRNMVDVSEVESLQRIARSALKALEETPCPVKTNPS